SVGDWISPPNPSAVGAAFKWLDGLLRTAQPWFPARSRQRAIEAAVDFVTERLNGENGLGGIYPAMADTVVMFDSLGYPPHHPHYATGVAAVKRLVVRAGDRSYCQPCFSPVWDTCLAGHAMLEIGGEQAEPVLRRACDWLEAEQVLDVVGDWAEARPGV